MRTEYCGHLNISHITKLVKICGWVDKVRNFKKFIFIDVRDCTGIIQTFFELKNYALFQTATILRNEFCIQIQGVVCARDKKNINLNMNTGCIEILVHQLNIFNISQELPIDYKNLNNNNDCKLKYRYLDLRRSILLENLKTRSKITHAIREFMHKHNFLDVETPVLTKSTPEGARDYLVPSRKNPGKFYALPQSPQLFKQILMISGIDKYYQIVKCFRDEDLRSDRQPEFTQIDMELSFITSDQVRELVETLIIKIWNSILKINLKKFDTLSFDECIKKYGSDKPDLRNPLEITEVSDLFITKKHILFFNLNGIYQNRIALLCVSQVNKISRKKIDTYINYVKKYNIESLFYIKITQIDLGCKGIQSSIKHILNDQILNKIIQRAHAKNGDVLFLAAGEKNIVNTALGKLRIKLGQELNITKTNTWKPLWVIDFPMFKKNINGNFSAIHHPFSYVKNMTVEQIKKNPELAISDSYDLVINGYEVGGGSVRIHKSDMQQTIFDIIGVTRKEQDDKFKFLIDALKYGAPPHAGIALGLDRIVMLITNSVDIRDVIAFPKTNSGACLMTNSPSIVEKIIIKEMGLKITKSFDNN